MLTWQLNFFFFLLFSIDQYVLLLLLHKQLVESGLFNDQCNTKGSSCGDLRTLVLGGRAVKGRMILLGRGKWWSGGEEEGLEFRVRSEVFGAIIIIIVDSSKTHGDGAGEWFRLPRRWRACQIIMHSPNSELFTGWSSWLFHLLQIRHLWLHFH